VRRTLSHLPSNGIRSAKRLGRIIGSRLPVSTTVDLIRATALAHDPHRVATTDTYIRMAGLRAVLSAETWYVDYCTLYGIVVDRVFDAPFAGMCVVDIGAHKGFYAANALRQGAIQVISYEPEAQNLAALRSTAIGSTRWTIWGDAVGSHAGEMPLNISTASWSHSSRQPISGSIVATQVVSMRTLKSVIDDAAERAAGAPLLVKINIEGMAGEIIASTAPHDLERIAALWLDVEDTDTLGAEAIAAHLSKAGMTIRQVVGGRHLFLRSDTATNSQLDGESSEPLDQT